MCEGRELGVKAFIHARTTIAIKASVTLNKTGNGRLIRTTINYQHV